MNLFIIKPFALIKDRETRDLEKIDFTASLGTVVCGRYDNESPPLCIFFTLT